MSAMRSRCVRAMLALIAGALVLTGCSFGGAYELPLPGKVVSESDGYKITAYFKDVVSVVPRTLVMSNDVPVGQVDSVTREGWNAKVVMTIKKDIVLPKTATAAVQQTSLLGEKYIALTAPTGSTVAKDGQLAAGTVLPLADNHADPEVEDVLGALSALLSGGGVAQLHTISVELNKAMNGRQAQMRGALKQVNAFIGSLDEQKATIVAAMDSVNRLATTLNHERSTIGDALDSFGPALQVLNQQHKGLVKMLASLNRLGKVGTSVITQSKDDLIATLKDLKPALKGLADAGDSLAPGLMLMASFPFPPAAATLAKGDYSNALFAMDINLDQLLRGILKGGHADPLPNIASLCAAYAGSGTCAPLMTPLCEITGVSAFCTANTGPGLFGGSQGSAHAKGSTKTTKPSQGSRPGLLNGLLGSGTPPASGGQKPTLLQRLLGGLL